MVDHVFILMLFLPAWNPVEWGNPFLGQTGELQKVDGNSTIYPVIFSNDDWGVQSPPERIVLGFQYHSQEVIGSLGWDHDTSTTTFLRCKFTFSDTSSHCHLPRDWWYLIFSNNFLEKTAHLNTSEELYRFMLYCQTMWNNAFPPRFLFVHTLHFHAVRIFQAADRLVTSYD